MDHSIELIEKGIVVLEESNTQSYSSLSHFIFAWMSIMVVGAVIYIPALVIRVSVFKSSPDIVFIVASVLALCGAVPFGTFMKKLDDDKAGYKKVHLDLTSKELVVVEEFPLRDKGFRETHYPFAQLSLGIETMATGSADCPSSDRAIYVQATLDDYSERYHIIRKFESEFGSANASMRASELCVSTGIKFMGKV